MASYRESYTVSAPELQDYEAKELPKSSVTAPELKDYEAKELPSYQAQEDKVNQTYDAKQQSSLAALETAYNQSMMDANATLEKIPATYRTQRNNAEAEYEKQRKAFAEYAANSGVSSGAGSQAQLAYSNQLQSDLNDIGVAQANATADAQLQISKIKQNYQDSVAQAIKENDYERAAALLSEYQKTAQSVVDVAQAQATEYYRAYQSQLSNQQYLAEWARTADTDAYERAKAQADEYYRAYQSQLANRQYSSEWERTADEEAYNRAKAQADTLAAYGDFSGYAALGYTSDQIAQMQAYWDALQTPTYSYSYSGGGSGGGSGSSGSSGYTPKASTATKQSSGIDMTPATMKSVYNTTLLSNGSTKSTSTKSTTASGKGWTKTGSTYKLGR